MAFQTANPVVITLGISGYHGESLRIGIRRDFLFQKTDE